MANRANEGMHRWKFFRSGGLDQVSLESGADLMALEQLDPKLWVALGCPVKGLEIDERTLALVDRDSDGRIAVPDVIAAVRWAGLRLKEPGVLLKDGAALSLESIAATTEEGRELINSARQILNSVGHPDATQITVEQATDTARIYAANPLRGDGIIPPEASAEPAVQALVRDIITVTGGTPRDGGTVGITARQIDEFFTALGEYLEWIGRSAKQDIAILGEATGPACAALGAVRAKVEDFFARVRLAAFDQRAIEALNRSESDYLAIAAKDLEITTGEVKAFPLARIAAGVPLPLLEGVNPAWAEPLATLHARAVVPLFGADKKSLTAAEWAQLNAKFSAYETWLGGKAGGSVEKLGLARAREIHQGPGRAALDALVVKDQALAPAFKSISDVERLVRYRRDLRTLLHNFVNFEDLYSPARPAAFQAGVLYLDSRSTELCIRVEGPNAIAAGSKIYIAYCNCTRAGAAPMTIAACITQGDADYLFVGRNGLFYDRQGRQWYATITSIVENAISIRQAFWSPYKKFIRMIEEQVAKRAAAADAASSGKLAAVAQQTANLDKTAAPAPAAPKKIDVGTVAALGVAVGAIGGALGAIATGLARLAIWQLPLVVVGIILVISLPSMAVAWLKLRQRTLGPVLEGNGWAINGRVKINIPFGASLTEVAELPAGSIHRKEDPYEDKEARRRRRLWVVLLVLLAILGAYFWDWHKRGHPIWRDGVSDWDTPYRSAEKSVAEPATPPPAPAQPAAK